jgi:hypothetical protein
VPTAPTEIDTPGDDLAASVRRAATVQQEVRLRHGLPPGERLTTGDPDDSGTHWVRCADLLDDPRLIAAWADRVTAWLDDGHGEAPDRTVAGYLLSWYLTVPAQAAALLFHTARRVPQIRPADLAVRFGPDHPRPDRIALLSDRFACLATDPAAAGPDATPVADDAALAAVLRDRYATHASPFLTVLCDALGERMRFGRRTLWASATDSLDGAFWRIGQYCGQEGVGVANAALVLPAPLAPFTSASTLRPTGGDPGGDPAADGWTRRRESCCFHYVLRTGVGPCATCPRVQVR